MEAEANYGACELGAISELTAAPAPEKFEAWGFVELMGHQRIAGRLSERAIAGRNLLQVDVPEGEGFRTVFYGGGAIFAMHVTDEAVARKLATRLGDKPVYAYQLDAAPRLPSRDDLDDDHNDN